MSPARTLVAQLGKEQANGTETRWRNDRCRGWPDGWPVGQREVRPGVLREDREEGRLEHGQQVRFRVLRSYRQEGWSRRDREVRRGSLRADRSQGRAEGRRSHRAREDARGADRAEGRAGRLRLARGRTGSGGTAPATLVLDGPEGARSGHAPRACRPLAPIGRRTPRRPGPHPERRVRLRLRRRAGRGLRQRAARLRLRAVRHAHGRRARARARRARRGRGRDLLRHRHGRDRRVRRRVRRLVGWPGRRAGGQLRADARPGRALDPRAGGRHRLRGHNGSRRGRARAARQTDHAALRGGDRKSAPPRERHRSARGARARQRRASRRGRDLRDPDPVPPSDARRRRRHPLPDQVRERTRRRHGRRRWRIVRGRTRHARPDDPRRRLPSATRGLARDPRHAHARAARRAPVRERASRRAPPRRAPEDRARALSGPPRPPTARGRQAAVRRTVRRRRLLRAEGRLSRSRVPLPRRARARGVGDHDRRSLHRGPLPADLVTPPTAGGRAQAAGHHRRVPPDVGRDRGARRHRRRPRRSARSRLSRLVPGPRALVFNCHITGLAVARSLAAHGVEVVALDPDPRGLGQASKAVVRRYACPNPLEAETAFADFLVERADELGRGAVLFPTNDEWVLAVARNRKRLAECYRIPFSELAAIDAVLDKRQLYAKAQRLGIPIPRTYSLADPAGTARAIRYPAIVKPAEQRRFYDRFGVKVFRAENADELVRFARQAADLTCVAQEVVDVPAGGFYSLCSYVGPNGEMRGAFVGRKLEQYPEGFGTGCLVVGEQVADIVERGTAILREFGYHGISEVEFIFDPERNEHLLLDVNPRVWKWIALPIASGVDLPWLAYSEAIGKPARAGAIRDGLRWIYERDYALLSRERRLFAASGDVVNAVWDPDDPGPFAQLIANEGPGGKYYCAC